MTSHLSCLKPFLSYQRPHDSHYRSMNYSSEPSNSVLTRTAQCGSRWHAAAIWIQLRPQSRVLVRRDQQRLPHLSAVEVEKLCWSRGREGSRREGEEEWQRGREKRRERSLTGLWTETLFLRSDSMAESDAVSTSLSSSLPLLSLLTHTVLPLWDPPTLLKALTPPPAIPPSTHTDCVHLHLVAESLHL